MAREVSFAADLITVGVMHVDTYGSSRDPEYRYRIVAEDAHGVLGGMDVTVFRDVANVDWIEVLPAQRRRGVASALYRKLYAWAADEGLEVKHGMTTEEGSATLEALSPELRALKQKLLARPG